MSYKDPRRINWSNLSRLTDDIPMGLDKSIKKKKIQPKQKEEYEKQDKGVCYVCGVRDSYGAMHHPIYVFAGHHNLHHIVPNGPATRENIVTLCHHCHVLVHEILYITGKWPYSRV